MQDTLKLHPQLLCRRRMVARLGGAAALGALPWPTQLSLIKEAAAQSAEIPTDRKALVCIYLAGGNDQSNTLLSLDAESYRSYARARLDLALPREALIEAPLRAEIGQSFGLHPSLKKIASLISSDRCSVVANVGMLTQPITLAQWNKGQPTVRVPRQLFSHSDQASLWHSGNAGISVNTGWAGRAADLLEHGRAVDVPMCISVAGNALLLSGSRLQPYQVTPLGAVPLRRYLGSASDASQAAISHLITRSNAGNLMEQQLGQLAERALSTEARVTAATAASKGLAEFKGGRLGAQLRMIARLIEAAPGLGHHRQIYFAQHGSYDFHANLLSEQAAKLTEFDEAVGDFQDRLETLGLAQQVTTFTMSDFGRALQSNGKGSDHGWGSHQLVLGGAIRGGVVHGKWPTVALQSADDAGNGRLIPTTSMEEFIAPLARWFGVANSDLSTVLPNSREFDTRKLKLFA